MLNLLKETRMLLGCEPSNIPMKLKNRQTDSLPIDMNDKCLLVDLFTYHLHNMIFSMCFIKLIHKDSILFQKGIEVDSGDDCTGSVNN